MNPLYYTGLGGLAYRGAWLALSTVVESYWLALMAVEKALAVLFIAICSGGLLLPSVGAEKVFYVKPTEPRTDCPSGDSPCHSLQYYANHSSFTNNSKFLFLEGEHHLDSVVEIRNVANVSLIGVSFGVEILCMSIPSGFHVEGFSRLSFENMTLSSCSGGENVAIYLGTGSDVSLNNVMVRIARGLQAVDVFGSFSIHNSTFSTAEASNILVNYSSCQHRPSYFNFSGGNLSAEQHGINSGMMALGVACSDIHIAISDSIFEVSNNGLSVNFNEELTNCTLLLDNNVFHASITVTNHCDENKLHCSRSFMKLTRNFIGFIASFHNIPANCTLVVEETVFSGSISPVFVFESGYDASNKSEMDGFIQAILNNVTFVNNTLPGFFGDLVCTSSLHHAAVLLTDCIFDNNSGSAIAANGSKVIFQGNNIFRGNSALAGGGLRLISSSIYLQPHTRILFENNRAYYVGGAIYTDYKSHDPCFFHVNTSSSENNTVLVNFVNNTADFAGSSLYGDITNCCSTFPCKEFMNFFNTSNTETNPSAVASDPEKICFCKEGKNQPSCSLYRGSTYSVQSFPGQEFPLRLAVVGSSYELLGPELDGVLPGAIRAFSVSAAVGRPQSSQVSSIPSCSIFKYSVNTTDLREPITISLIPEESFVKTITGDMIIEFGHILDVTVYFKPCPPGFILSATGSCVCDKVLGKQNIQCFINDQSILRPANSWIGFINDTFTASGVIFHPNCPTGYCLPCKNNITFDTRDIQCEPHRSGLLCGKCKSGYSLTLGNKKCTKCSNIYLLLILPLALTGLLLVAFLFTLNLTVTEGSINGLIFYANVIGMTHTIVFSEDVSYLYTFLAWLNLDLGISTCLYHGMDSYAETWLQFVFPMYLWVIILVVIQLYRKFPQFANKLGGENAVKVLATIFLLSYTKLQQTVVSILSFTSLKYPDGVVRYVWLYDANVEYFNGKHLYLGIAGIFVLVFLIVPYTLCLVLFQQLQACSGHRLFQWVNKLKPVFDSYAGPYKDKYRFWPGLLLVARTLLIILFTLNVSGSEDLNLLIILVVSCSLIIASSSGTYKKWPHNYLESFFYAQLVVFAGGVAYARHNNGSVTAVAETSFGLSLIVFVAALAYHVIHRTTTLRKYYFRLKGYVSIEEDPSVNHERIDAD